MQDLWGILLQGRPARVCGHNPRISTHVEHQPVQGMLPGLLPTKVCTCPQQQQQPRAGEWRGILCASCSSCWKADVRAPAAGSVLAPQAHSAGAAIKTCTE